MVNIFNNIRDQKHVFIGVACFILFVLLAASLGALNGQKDSFRLRKEQLQTYQHDLDGLDRILSESQEHDTQIALVKSLFPNDYDQVALFAEELERVANEKGLNPEIVFDHNLKDESSGISSLKLTLDTKGSFSDLSELLSELSVFSYPLRFDQLRVESSGTQVLAKTTFRVFVNK